MADLEHGPLVSRIEQQLSAIGPFDYLALQLQDTQPHSAVADVRTPIPETHFQLETVAVEVLWPLLALLARPEGRPAGLPQPNFYAPRTASEKHTGVELREGMDGAGEGQLEGRVAAFEGVKVIAVYVLTLAVYLAHSINYNHIHFSARLPPLAHFHYYYLI
jgi:hypothetical protein